MAFLCGGVGTSILPPCEAFGEMVVSVFLASATCRDVGESLLLAMQGEDGCCCCWGGRANNNTREFQTFYSSVRAKRNCFVETGAQYLFVLCFLLCFFDLVFILFLVFCFVICFCLCF